MGFNISGIVIDKNYEEDFISLQKELGWILEKQSDINFQTASSNWKDEGICDVYFSETGTLLFLSMDMCAQCWPVKSNKTFTFALSETSMAFNIGYCEYGVEKRSFMVVNGEKLIDTGSKLEVEQKSEDPSEIIWNQLEVMLGKSFWGINESEKATRYVFVKDKKPIDLTSKKVDLEKPISQEDFKNNFSDALLLQTFDQIVEFAQKNQINLFLYPWAHKNNSRQFMNLFSIIKEIMTRPKLANEIAKRMPLQRFAMICRFDPEKVDPKINADMIAEMNKIKINLN